MTENEKLKRILAVNRDNKDDQEQFVTVYKGITYVGDSVEDLKRKVGLII